METIKSLWLKFKQYPYKMWTSVLILVVLSSIDYYLQMPILSYLKLCFFIGLALLPIIAFFVGCYNVYKKDGDKVEAIIFFVLGIAFMWFVVYLLFFRQSE